MVKSFFMEALHQWGSKQSLENVLLRQRELDRVARSVGAVSANIKGINSDVDIRNVASAGAFISDQLNDVTMQHMLFDARQAAVFAEMSEPPPQEAVSRLQLPFDRFYLEFTQPIQVGEQEPIQREHPDQLRALLVHKISDKAWDNSKIKTVGGARPTNIYQVTLLFSNADGNYIDRSFKFDVTTGQGLITRYGCDLAKFDPSELPENINKFDVFRAGQTFLDKMVRHVGWWERAVQDYAMFLSWVSIYMMAKGISIREQPLTKKARKQLAANNAPVVPWHVIVVEPQVGSSLGEGTQQGRTHSYRYDVMGHLRFGKHRIRLEDGEWGYRKTVEWVSPHQRGIQNSRYVPAIRQYKQGKATHPAFQEYMKGNL